METHNINPDNTYKDHDILSKNKKVSTKQNSVPLETLQSDDHLKKTSLPIACYHVGTKVAFSIDNDLHIVVTTVKDTNTNTVIRQIPSEETMNWLKFFNRNSVHPLLNKVDYHHKHVVRNHKDTELSNLI